LVGNDGEGRKVTPVLQINNQYDYNIHITIGCRSVTTTTREGVDQSISYQTMSIKQCTTELICEIEIMKDDDMTCMSVCDQWTDGAGAMIGRQHYDKLYEKPNI